MGEIMNFNKAVIIFSCLLIVLICINSIAASEDVNVDENNLTLDSSNSIDLNESDVNEEVLEDEISENKLASCEDDLLGSDVIIVDENGGNFNEMNKNTIKNAINNAKDGDTIMIYGNYYEHCHIVVNKKLTIIGNGTILSPCSSTATSNHQGIFYLTSKASGTVIEGFKFVDDLGLTDDEAYGVLAKGTSDVAIKNCEISTYGSADSIRFENVKNSLIQNVTVINSINGIKLKNSNNIAITRSNIINSKYGINIVDSTQTTVESNNISNNNIAGIAFSGSSSYLTAIYNNITENGNGVNLTSSQYVYILSNYISFNKQHGVYVDVNVTKIEIKGNFFNQNNFYEVYDDFHVRNLDQAGGEKLQYITNNYMIGKDDNYDRPIWRQIYDNTGTEYIYDSVNDVYVYVGSGNGNYGGHQTSIYLGYIFEVNEYMECPNIYYKYAKRNQKPWSQSGNYFLQLSEISQIKKGVYTISIVDAEGNIATDISSVPITFYLNKNKVTNSPEEGDIYKTVMMVNGTATVRFFPQDFNETGNVVMACAPGFVHNQYYSEIPYKTFAVDDNYIPGNVTQTKISVSNLNTYPNSNAEFIATLTDLNGNPIVSEKLTFKINSKSYTADTGSDGKAKIKVSIASEGTYALNVNFVGDDIDYTSSSAKATVTVKKTATKIVSSNLAMIPKMAEYYSITLRDASGRALSNQKVTFKVNGKTYAKTTNSKGVAKVKLKFNKNKKTYKITIKFAGNTYYKAISKTNKITVKYSSKKAKLTVPKVTIPPKTTKYYTITLKDANGKGISKQKITVKLNGKKYTKKTNSKGQVKIKVQYKKLRSYKVTANYNGNKIYKKASGKGKITVQKTATKITAPTVTTFPNTAKTYTVSLKTSAGKALAKQKIKMVLNGKTYSKTTNAKGQASISVKFAAEKSYKLTASYGGNGIYKSAKATGYIKVARTSTKLVGYNQTFSKGSGEYIITLKDNSNNAISNQAVSYKLNGQSFSQNTDANGQIKVNVNSLGVGSYGITSSFAQTNQYKSASATNSIIIVDKSNTVFIDANIPNEEIQQRMNSAADGSNVEFLGQNYNDVSLTVNKALSISSNSSTILNGKSGNNVFRIVCDNVSISNLIINSNSASGIVVEGNNVNIENNIIANILDKSKMDDYNAGTKTLPGFGIKVTGSDKVNVKNNNISSFYSAIFAENTNNLEINNNTLTKSNYGITYGVNVANTQILNNLITKNIGLYVMDVPEGPLGYGIFFNQSAVNVTVQHNNVTDNYMGISIDSNFSTGIVITGNLISDNALEGIRFNAGYDLAENAVEPVVTDNAIYRNAKGPSLMILGEMSANPAGIYGGGLTNASLRLKISPNWYGKNELVTWDNDTGVVGYGTMCPRINTTAIKFNEIACVSPGTYSITFYKNGEIASNLPVFEMYATLNNNTEKIFNVVNGIGEVSFDSQDFDAESNIIYISIGSLKDTTRYFEVLMNKTLDSSEIPV
jgi:nitrous oxidase accessory protein NosD